MWNLHEVWYKCQNEYVYSKKSDWVFFHFLQLYTLTHVCARLFLRRVFFHLNALKMWFCLIRLLLWSSRHRIFLSLMWRGFISYFFFGLAIHELWMCLKIYKSKHFNGMICKEYVARSFGFAFTLFWGLCVRVKKAASLWKWDAQNT